jgi:hypothetical protein
VQQPPPYWILAIGTVASLSGFVFLALQRSRAAVLFFFLGLVFVVSFGWRSYKLVRLRHLLESGRYEVVEGVVFDFRPMPPSGHAVEHFCVERKCFNYAENLTPGFNQTMLNGGPIHEGLTVRIRFTGNNILRLEIK